MNSTDLQPGGSGAGSTVDWEDKARQWHSLWDRSQDTIAQLRGALEAAQGELRQVRETLAITDQVQQQHFIELGQKDADLAQARARITRLEGAIREQVMCCGRCGGLGTIHGLRGVEVCGECNALRDALDAAQAADKVLPTIDELAGSDPDFTGGLSTEEYIREMRGGRAAGGDSDGG